MTTERDPAWMTPDERRQELAAILAAGVRQLRDRHVLYAADGDVPPAESPRRNPLRIALVFPRKPCSVSTRVDRVPRRKEIPWT